MSESEKINYKKIGLKVGLEIHQQLDTKEKLFCGCSTAMQEREPVAIIMRKQHPVASELGEIDIAAQHEYLRDRTFYYQVFKNESCLVELDEEPPHEINPEALNVALQVALLLNCQIPEEIEVMRKTVIDGSNPTGFQRTMIIGMNGFLKYKGKKIEIRSISLEEDAAAIVAEEKGKVTYRLNRLGIPLVEISTGIIQGFSPEEIEDIAYQIGMICRSTGKTKRGIGTIRQDLNISIKGCERTEIKGVQELGLLSKVIENEVRRQLSLLSIKAELRKKGVKKINFKPVDVSNFLKDSNCRILRAIVETGGKVFALRLPNFGGYLKREIFPGKTLGKELAEFVQIFGLEGIIHSDEDLAKYKVEADFKKIREFLKAKEEDAIILVGEPKTEGKVSEELLKKINRILEVGSEKETRAADEQGITRFTRPLPGAARLYPETDVKPVLLTKEFLEKLRKELPEPWTKKYERFKKQYKLSDELAKPLLESKYFELFEEILKKHKVAPAIVANTFVNTLKDLHRREKVEVERITEKHFFELFEALEKKEIVKEAIPEILKYLASYPGESVENVIRELNLRPISLNELKKIVEEVLTQPGLSYEKAIGIVMSQVRGRIEAQTVMETVKKLMKK
ncbi:MAG: Glu-tRNA(Gln) amidotransferase subunit GatE [Candidatus Aenigmatarchaeota archaeon]